MKDKHKKDRVSGTSPDKVMSQMVGNVFEMLYRKELKYTSPHININFMTSYLQNIYGNHPNLCGIAIVRHIMQMLSVEHIPNSVIKKAVAYENENDDVVKFHKTSVVNRLFAFLLNRKIECPKKHRSEKYKSLPGLTL